MRTAILPLLALSVLPACIVVVGDDGCDVRSGWSKDVVRGSGVARSEPRALPAFERVRTQGSFEIAARVGPAQSVTLTTDDNLLEQVVTEVAGGELRVRWRNDHDHAWSPQIRPRLELSVPALRGVTIEGSGDVALEGLQGGALELAISGSGDVHASGSVDALSADVSGSGDLRLYGLAARTARVVISGSGSAEVQASEELVAETSGSGSVRYRGAPPRVRSEVLGSGSVRPAP
jgi:hypothetical protein